MERLILKPKSFNHPRHVDSLHRTCYYCKGLIQLRPFGHNDHNFVTNSAPLVRKINVDLYGLPKLNSYGAQSISRSTRLTAESLATFIKRLSQKSLTTKYQKVRHKGLKGNINDIQILSVSLWLSSCPLWLNKTLLRQPRNRFRPFRAIVDPE